MSQTAALRRRLVLYRRIATVCIVFVALYYLRFSSYRYSDWAELREQLVSTQSETLDLAVVWPRDRKRGNSLIRGAIQAAEEINRGGGVLLTAPDRTEYSAKVRLRFFDEESTSAGVRIAQKIATDADIKAAIGHDTSSAVKASLIYNQSGTLFISPMNVDPALTMHGFHNVFSIAPAGVQISKAMADSVGRVVGRKQIRLSVLAPETLQEALAAMGEDLADRLTHHVNHLIESHGNRIDFRVVFSQPYAAYEADYSELIQPLVTQPKLFNSILIMDDQAAGLKIRRQLEQQLADVGVDEQEQRIFDLRDPSTAQVLVTYKELSPEELDAHVQKAAELILREFRLKVAILATRDQLGNIIGSSLSSFIDETHEHPVNGLDLAVFRTFPAEQRSSSHIPITANILQHDIEVVFIAGTAASAYDLVRQMREGGMDKPVICVPGLEPRILRPLVGPEVRMTVLQMQEHNDNVTVDEAVAELEKSQRLKETIERAPKEFRKLVEWYLAKLRIDHWLSEQPHLDLPGLRTLLKRSFPGVKISDSVLRGYISDYHGGTYVVAAFNPGSSSQLVRNFEHSFRRRWLSGPPDSLAAAGYQSVKLLADAFHKAGSASPKSAAAAMLMYVGEDGIFGTNWFSPSGNMLGLDLVMKRLAPDGSITVFEIGGHTDQNSIRQLPVDPWGE